MARGIKVKCVETGEMFPSCRSAARWLLSTGQIKPHCDPMKFKNPVLRDPKYATYGEPAISGMIRNAALHHNKYNEYHWEFEPEYEKGIIEERRNKEKKEFTEILESKNVDEKTRKKAKKALLKLDEINNYNDFRKIPVSIWIEERQTWIII